jgi:hypothetical protein
MDCTTLLDHRMMYCGLVLQLLMFILAVPASECAVPLQHRCSNKRNLTSGTSNEFHDYFEVRLLKKHCGKHFCQRKAAAPTTESTAAKKKDKGGVNRRRASAQVVFRNQTCMRVYPAAYDPHLYAPRAYQAVGRPLGFSETA